MKKRRSHRLRRKASDDNSVRLLILSFVILLTVVFKTITGVSTVTVLKDLSAVITGERSFSTVINTIGEAISEGTKENVIAVFGRDKDIGDGKQEDEHVLPVVKEPTEETEETIKGREKILPAFNREIKITQLEFVENEEEYFDDTENIPFKVPAPNNVDYGKYEISFQYIRPCNGYVTSPFGYRVHPISKETTFHYGIDLAADNGSIINSFADGQVADCGYSKIFGNYIKIKHTGGFVSFYAHLSRTLVKKGETVKRGEQVGKAGDTGVATGPHLHFEIRKNGKVVDPIQYFDE